MHAILENNESIISLLFNGLIMLGLLSLYAIFRVEYKDDNIIKKITRGLIMGIIVVIVMTPLGPDDDGIYHDARNIILSISGVFFGIIPTLTAMTFGVLYRILLGGSGLALGVVEIISASFIGLAWPYLQRKGLKKLKIFNYFILGLVIHLMLYVFYLIIPPSLSLGFKDFFEETAFVYLVLYPFLTMSASYIIKNHYEFIGLTEVNKKQSSVLNASINAPKKMEIYVLDVDYNYLAYNDFHANQMKEYYLREDLEGENFLNYVENTKMNERLKKSFDKAKLGIEHQVVSEVEVTKGKYVEETFSPLIEGKDNIVGVTVFSVDVTERIAQAKRLEKLSYFDPLTKVHNRRHFEQRLDVFNITNEALSIVYFDINGLKTINDTFGHKKGDLLLIEVANELVNVMGKYGDVCRIGGDEFIILLPNISVEDATTLSEEAKDNLSKKTINHIVISASYGIHSRTKDEDIAVDDLVINAENAMYIHKLTEKSSHRSQNIQAILNTLKLMHANEERHSIDVGRYSVEIGKRMGLSESNLELLRMIANLHDIGKVGIDQDILNKPGKLTDEEFAIIKRHPEIGYRLLSDVPEYREIAYDILSHHERFDGKGYPNGLVGTNIPLRARIVSVADAYDAMTSDRPYRKALSKEVAIEELKKNSGTQFDPEIVDCFLEVLKEI